MKKLELLLLFFFLVPATLFAGVTDLRVAPLESNLYDFDVKILEVKGLGSSTFSFNLINAGNTSKIVFIPSPSFEEAYLHTILSDGSAETLHFVLDPTAPVYHKVSLKHSAAAVQESLESSSENFQIGIAEKTVSLLNRLEEAHQVSLDFRREQLFGLEEKITKYWTFRKEVAYEVTVHNVSDDDIEIRAADYLDDFTLGVFIPGMDEFGRYSLAPGEATYIYILKEKL